MDLTTYHSMSKEIKSLREDVEQLKERLHKHLWDREDHNKASF